MDYLFLGFKLFLKCTVCLLLVGPAMSVDEVRVWLNGE